MLAAGEPLYCGVFCPGSVCSYSHSDGVPTITGQTITIRSNLTANVAFSIQRGLPFAPPTATDAGPGASLGPARLADGGHKLDEVLDDPRLIAAARKLFPGKKP